MSLRPVQGGGRAFTCDLLTQRLTGVVTRQRPRTRKRGGITQQRRPLVNRTSGSKDIRVIFAQTFQSRVRWGRVEPGCEYSDVSTKPRRGSPHARSKSFIALCCVKDLCYIRKQDSQKAKINIQAIGYCRYCISGFPSKRTRADTVVYKAGQMLYYLGSCIVRET